MLPLPLISLTTPSLNTLKALDQTLLSIATQAGAFRIHLHVQDGGSTDGSLDRLTWWQEQIRIEQFPLQCQQITFSFDTAPGSSTADQLAQGIEHCRGNGSGFVGWLKPGDILMPGALAFVADVGLRFAPEQISWISGARSQYPGQHPASLPGSQPEDLPLSRAALAAGLCDGVHGPMVQSAGTFFRPWLWDKATKADTGSASEDTDIWQCFAAFASLTQTRFALAATAQPPAVTEEIPEQTRISRRAALTELASTSQIRRFFDGRPGDQDLFVVEEDYSEALAAHHQQVFGVAPDITAEPARRRDTLRAAPVVLPDHKPLDEVISHRANILAFDSDWQYPAVTEQHAFHQLRDLGAVPDGVTYMAYPWATLIDKLQRKSQDAEYHLERFKAFCAQIPDGDVKVTVCQHIKMREMLPLFHEAGISHIFWTHSTQTDLASGAQDGLTLHPFPLFPVQIADNKETPERAHLFSFIGARANQHYLTQSRNWILDLLGNHPRGEIIGRGSWHYNRVVYDHQVRAPGAQKSDGDKFIDQDASAQFRDSLSNSLFSLCPSGTGPNSIRLWESLGAGTIPVILADSYAPPGNPALWQAAAVVCRETPEAIRTLPARLEQIAADPEALAKMRHAGQQLWALYGPQAFVYDIQTFMLTAGAPPQSGSGPQASFVVTLTRTLADKGNLSDADAQLLLQSLASDLLLNGTEAHFLHETDPLIQRLEDQARMVLPADHPLVTQLNRSQALLRHRSQALSAPALSRGGKMRICLLGKHSNRTPLSYAPFRQLAQDRAEIVKNPFSADIILSGYNIDLRDNADTLQQLAQKNPRAKTVILSEEPLWDSIWSDGFTARDRQVQLGDLTLDYRFLNHSNSTIFAFDQIPYFLLTNEDFQARYGLLMARHCDLSPQALCNHWQQAPVTAAFFAEARDKEAYAKSFPDQQVYGLSVYRTAVARQVQLPGTLRIGQGWQPQARRQALPDWHLDKLATLDMRVRVMAAYENTHQRAYVSEKIFDAFVTGGIPTYYADAQHRVLGLVPETCMINTFGLSAEEAAARISSFTPDLDFAEAWLATARNLQQRFTNLKAIRAERQRITNTVLEELEAYLS